MANLPENLEIKQAIVDYCRAKGISSNELANQIQVSSATLSKIANDNWEGISEKLKRKIWNRVGINQAPELLETADFKACFTTCDNARKHHFMIGLIGDTGTGKTTALNTYALRKNVFYVAYDKTMKPKQFFISLLREMGIAFEGSINEMVNRISEELNTLSNPLVIVDEAGKITHTMILYLHVLRDKTYKNCGIVLGGMPYFKTNLIKFSNKEKEGYAEFYRRVNLWHSLNGLTRKEIEEVCALNGITDKDTLRELQSKKRFGELYNAILLQRIQSNL